MEYQHGRRDRYDEGGARAHGMVVTSEMSSSCERVRGRPLDAARRIGSEASWVGVALEAKRVTLRRSRSEATRGEPCCDSARRSCTPIGSGGRDAGRPEKEADIC